MELYSLGLKVQNSQLFILDQTRLPLLEEWVHASSPEVTAKLIHRLAIRGAPLIGVSAALSLALYANSDAKLKKEDILIAAQLLENARPTAVNLRNCLQRCVSAYEKNNFDPKSLLVTAEEIFHEDVNLCLRMAVNGFSLINDGDHILTHCNTGGLATVGMGTALGVIKHAHQNGKKVHVFVDETRPLLQGARLTTWELKKEKIPFTLICDSMSSALMSKGKVQKIFTGADRIANNGDSANKIGTYHLAISAKYHQVPFYIVAPSTTLDLKCPTGNEIPIEMRDASEISSLVFNETQSKTIPGWNPSFDVTPANLITGIVLDTGIRNLN